MTVAEYIPPADPVQERVEVPEGPRITLVGVRVQLTPLDDETERFTVPWNPLALEAVMVELAAVPTGAERTAGFAEIEKSGVSAVMNADLTKDPEVPVTAITNSPFLATLGFETVAVTVADPPAVKVTLVALSVAESPPGGTEVES